MITIVVSDRADLEDGDEAELEEFVLPRALLCAYSEYFETALEKQWLEGQSRHIELNDVHPLTFRVFVGWLFFQTIFLDEERQDPDEPVEDQPDDPEQDSMVDADTAMTMVAESGSLGPQSCVIDLTSSTADETEAVPKSNVKESFRFVLWDHTADLHGPLTWSWMDLFELYVFVDKYSTRRLRLQVFDIIQLKLIKLHSVPKASMPAAITYLVENQPKNSKLVDMLARQSRSCTPRFFEKNQEFLSDFPASFLVRILMYSTRYRCASACISCMRKDPEAHCEEHSKEDFHSLRSLPACHFHEHGGDEEEESACTAAWKIRIAALPKK